MDKKYWDDIVPQHKEKIFDVFDHDRKGVIVSSIRKYAKPGQSALDLGCAIGKWLPSISAVSGKVYAVDIAQSYLNLAKKRNGAHKNIEYIQQDLSKPNNNIPKCDMALCVNTLLTDNGKRRQAIFQTVVNTVKKEGFLVLVVPSLESALLSKFMLKQWDIMDHMPVERFSPKSKEDAFSGIVELDGTPTKHFLREEIMFELHRVGFEIKETEKVEYTWDTEFNDPPKWMNTVFPWDWLMVGQRVK